MPSNSAITKDSAAEPSAIVTIASVDVDGRNVTVGGFVTQISEEGASCRFDIERVDGTDKVSASTVATARVGTTS